MNFTPRLRQILLLMLKEKQKSSIKQLAQEIGVSKRTVQRELEYIDGSLKRYGISFQSKTGTGVWLEGTEEDKKRLMDDLAEENVMNIADRAERRKRLILEMLKDRTPQKLYYYSNLFGVSEATISADMDAIGGWFEPFHLKILRKQGYGVMVQGSEKDYRRAMRSFIDENIDTQMIRDVYDNKSEVLMQVLGSKDKKNMYRILDQSILKRVISCILNMNDRHITNLTESSYVGLILHVTIAVNRILKQEIIEENSRLLKKLERDEEYQAAFYISQVLEEEFHIEIPEIETAYIWLHLKGAKRQYLEADSDRSELDKEQERLFGILDQMIDSYDKEQAYTLKQDEEFVRGLLAHLEPTLIRLSNGMNITNPLLSQIQKDYEAVYEKCRLAASVIEKELNCKVPEAEIGFLAIHFGAALVRLENQKESKRMVRIGIICASGIGISQLMCTKVKRFFGNRAEISAYAKGDVTPFIQEKTDFFISSIPFELESADVLYVSPLLVEDDMNQIEKKIYHYERIPKEKQEIIFTKQLEQVNYVAAQIKTIIKEMFCLKVNNRITFKELLVAMSEKLTIYAEKREQIQRDIMTRERLATQIFPEFGFALLHTRTRGVIKPSFSLCFGRGLQPFADPYFRQIRVVILMLVPKDENARINSEILGFLSSALIEEPFFLDSILTGDQETIRNELSKYLKQYFNQYLEKIS